MSRPSTRLSHASTSSTHTHNVPFTPRAGINGRISATRLGGLSAKQVDKISHTIASVRRPTRRELREIDERDEYAYLPERSFSTAPLNSRLPPASPHRALDEEWEEEEEDIDDSVGGNLRDRSVVAPIVKKNVCKEPLKRLDLELQEALIVEDLLFVLMGIEGQYIEFHPDYSPEDDFERLQGARWLVDPELDPSFSDLLQRILPLATYYTAIEAFIEQQSHLSFGLVNHALCSAIRDMLREYLYLIAQLEHQFSTVPSFTLQRLWFYINPTVHSLELVNDLTSELIAIAAGDEEEEESDGSGSGSDEDDLDDLSDGGIGGEGVRAVLGEMQNARKASKAEKAAKNTRAGPVMGGEVLNVIYQLLSYHSGDPTAVEIYSSLLLKASQPYARMLLKWVGTGYLEDPYDEFLVRENKSITRGTLEMDYTDEYWERRYTLKDNNAGVGSKGEGVAMAREHGLVGGAVVPPFLEGWKTKVLLAGKYLNVVRECGAPVAEDEEEKEKDQESSKELPKEVKKETKREREKRKEREERNSMVAMDSEGFYKRIDKAYIHANKALLKLLLNDQHLLPRLKSMKIYFFLDPGDTFNHFLDLAGPELSKKARQVSIEKLQSLLDVVIRNPSSATYSDPYKDDIKVDMSQSTLFDWLMKVVNVSGMGEEGIEVEAAEKEEKESDKATLTGVDALTLDYTVKFPLSLVISRKNVLRYQLIFRHLLQLKHLEQSLIVTWLDHAKLPVWRKRTSHPQLERWKSRVFSLRSRMLTFLQQMYSFCVGEVLEPNWRSLEMKLEKVETVDELLRAHVDFLDTCLKECMLTNAKLLKCHSKIMHTCSLFVSYHAKFRKALEEATQKLEQSDGDHSQVSITKEIDFLDRFESNFNRHSKVHLDMVTYFASSENLALLALVVRLSNLKLPT